MGSGRALERDRERDAGATRMQPLPGQGAGTLRRVPWCRRAARSLVDQWAVLLCCLVQRVASSVALLESAPTEAAQRLKTSL